MSICSIERIRQHKRRHAKFDHNPVSEYPRVSGVTRSNGPASAGRRTSHSRRARLQLPHGSAHPCDNRAAEMTMDIRAANRDYERWLTAQLQGDIVAADLK